MLRKKKIDKQSTGKQSDEISMDKPESTDEISFEESGDSPKEMKSIEEFLEMKKRQNEVLKKIIENMDKPENR